MSRIINVWNFYRILPQRSMYLLIKCLLIVVSDAKVVIWQLYFLVILIFEHLGLLVLITQGGFVVRLNWTSLLNIRLTRSFLFLWLVKNKFLEVNNRHHDVFIGDLGFESRRQLLMSWVIYFLKLPRRLKHLELIIWSDLLVYLIWNWVWWCVKLGQLLDWPNIDASLLFWLHVLISKLTVHVRHFVSERL